LTVVIDGFSDLPFLHERIGKVDISEGLMVLETGGEDGHPGFPHLLRTEQAGGGRLFGNCGDYRRENIVEKCRSRRVSVRGDVSGRTVLAADLDIRDLASTASASCE
jgi:hypothetical protein